MNTFELVEPSLKAAQALIPNAINDQLTKRERDRCSGEEWNLSGIDSDGITYRCEYNDSCHCHPEWQTATVYISWEQINHKINADLEASVISAGAHLRGGV